MTFICIINIFIFNRFNTHSIDILTVPDKDHSMFIHELMDKTLCQNIISQCRKTLVILVAILNDVFRPVIS